MQTDPASYPSALSALVRALSEKDQCTGDHVLRVVHYAMRIAASMPDLDPAELGCLRVAALLHDVGKMGIEDRILKKTSALNADEWASMRTHPELGRGILENTPTLNEFPELLRIAECVRFHHERWDGQGYPDGLRGERIPRIARIISVADAFDAMVSARPYRQAMSPAKAFGEIVAGSGTQFDPAVVEAFRLAFELDLALCGTVSQSANSYV